MYNVALQASGGIFIQLTEWLLNPTSSEGVAVYLLLVVAFGWPVNSSGTVTADDEPEVDFSDVLDEETLEEGHVEGQLLTTSPRVSQDGDCASSHRVGDTSRTRWRSVDDDAVYR